MHIVIMRFSSLGDIILNSSLMTALKNHYGQEVELTFLTSKAFAPLLEGHPYLSNVESIPREKGILGIKRLKQKLTAINKNRPIDLLIDLHGTLRAIIVRFMFPQIPRLVIDKRTFERWLLCSLKIDLLSNQGKEEDRAKHFGELLLTRTVRDFAYVFGLRPKLEYYSELPGKDYGQLSSLAQTFQGSSKVTKNITIVPTASFKEKRWPLKNFITLVERVLNSVDFKEHPVTILAGPDDEFCRIFDRFEKEYPQRFKNLQGKTSLLETAGIGRESFFCVGNDTGVPHMTEALGRPALFILGPTGEEFGFTPHLTPSRVVCKRLWCRPCTTNGKGHCIRSRRYCLEDISVDEVFDQMILLKKSLEMGHA